MHDCPTVTTTKADLSNRLPVSARLNAVIRKQKRRERWLRATRRRFVLQRRVISPSYGVVLSDTGPVAIKSVAG